MLRPTRRQGILNMVETFHYEAARVIEQLPDVFTSHQFLRLYIMGYTNSYLQGLAEYHDVTILHQQIGRYLLHHADDADINIRYVEDRTSITIFGREDNIAVWIKKNI